MQFVNWCRPPVIVLVYLVAVIAAAVYGCTEMAGKDPEQWSGYPLGPLGLVTFPAGPLLASATYTVLSFAPAAMTVDSAWVVIPALFGGGLIQAGLFWYWSARRAAPPAQGPYPS